MVYITQYQNVVDEEAPDVQKSGIGKSEEGKDSAPWEGQPADAESCTGQGERNERDPTKRVNRGE